MFTNDDVLELIRDIYTAAVYAWDSQNMILVHSQIELRVANWSQILCSQTIIPAFSDDAGTLVRTFGLQECRVMDIWLFVENIKDVHQLLHIDDLKHPFKLDVRFKDH